MENFNLIIPTNIDGKESDIEYSITFNSRDEAVECFKRAYKRMLNPPIWHELCGSASANFTLIGENGDNANRLTATNDYFQIDIPGPGTVAGDGYDWAKVELIEERINPHSEDEFIGMRLRPSNAPGTESEDTAHFFQHTATSSFIIKRDGNKVTASYHGRNEKPNLHTNNAIDNIRNTMIAAGAFAGLSELQWSTLIKSFLQPEIGG